MCGEYCITLMKWFTSIAEFDSFCLDSEFIGLVGSIRLTRGPSKYRCDLLGVHLNSTSINEIHLNNGISSFLYIELVI